MFLIAQRVDIYPGDGKHPFARTGDLSFSHLKRAGAQGVLLGHSEAGERIEVVNAKLQAAYDAELQKNIVLLGEAWEDIGKPWNELFDKEKERVKTLIKTKCLKVFEGISSQVLVHTVLSYEPAWGVRGSGKSDVPPPQPDQIREITKVMRGALADKYGPETEDKLRIIYGGSMSPERAVEMISLQDVDGFILGSAGTKTEGVKRVADSLADIKKGRKPVLALNWKAYELEEPYEKFLETLKPYGEKMDIYIAPPATDLYLLSSKLKVQS